MLLFWRKNKIIDNFANMLADELSSQLPVESLEKVNHKKLARRYEKEIERLVIKLRDFKTIQSLGVYGKARFHLTFMERLREHGYEENFVKELNDILMLKVS